jgi:hypothetical protein
MSSGANTVSVRNFTGTTLVSNGQQGSIYQAILLTNSTTAGTWDFHSFLPTGANFGTSGLVYQGNLTFTGSANSTISQSGAGVLTIANPTLSGTAKASTILLATGSGSTLISDTILPQKINLLNNNGAVSGGQTFSTSGINLDNSTVFNPNLLITQTITAPVAGTQYSSVLPNFMGVFSNVGSNTASALSSKDFSITDSALNSDILITGNNFLIENATQTITSNLSNNKLLFSDTSATLHSISLDNSTTSPSIIIKDTSSHTGSYKSSLFQLYNGSSYAPSSIKAQLSIASNNPFIELVNNNQASSLNYTSLTFYDITANFTGQMNAQYFTVQNTSTADSGNYNLNYLNFISGSTNRFLSCDATTLYPSFNATDDTANYNMILSASQFNAVSNNSTNQIQMANDWGTFILAQTGGQGTVQIDNGNNFQLGMVVTDNSTTGYNALYSNSSMLMTNGDPTGVSSPLNQNNQISNAINLYRNDATTVSQISIDNKNAYSVPTVALQDRSGGVVMTLDTNQLSSYNSAGFAIYTNNGLTIQDTTGSKSHIILNNLPTSATGLPANTVWRDSLGYLRIV